MRAALVCLVLAACSADIVPGSFLCGPQQACSPGYVCSGSDNSCEDPSTATAFACTAQEEASEPDDSPATGAMLPALGCVSELLSIDGCLAAGDSADWYQLATPSGCTAVAVNLEITYPIANEPLGVMLGDASGATLAPDTTCATTATNAEDNRCITMTLANSTGYTIEVLPSGGSTCDGACAYNRYTLAVQLVTPN
jgi:hypothetical protein